MKTDLQILIEHVQAEYDYLKMSMEDCIAAWDFDGAKAFRAPLIFTTRKLNVLKCLENPNFNKINLLEAKISNMEKSLTERNFEMEYLDEQTRHLMEEFFKQSTIDRIEKSKVALDNLKLIERKQGIDNDRVLELLEDLEQNRITVIEFEIKKDKLFLLLTVSKDHGELELRTPENVNIQRYLTSPILILLKELGFDTESLKKQILNFGKLEKLKVLEDLAIIYFEVFEIFGGVRNIKIE